MARGVVLVTARPATLAILPIQLRVGDRLSYADGEWEVVGEPSGLYGGKMVEGRGWRVRKITRPRSTWPGSRTRR